MQEVRKQNHKRGHTAMLFVALLAVLIVLGFKSGVTAHAATSSVWNTYNPTIEAKNDWAKGLHENGWWKLREGSENGAVLFCTQNGVVIPSGTVSYNTSTTGGNTTDAQRQHISVIAYYGYYATDKSLTNEMFTQYRIWEYLGDTLQSSSDYYSQYENWKKDVDAKVANFEKTPSFSNKTISVGAGGSTTVTDSNGSLGSYVASASSQPSGITATTSGNTLTVKAASNADVTDGVISFKTNIPASYQGVPLVFTRSGAQNVVKPAIDPVNKTFKIKVTVAHQGRVTLTKKDAETGSAQNGASFAGAQFKLTDTTSGKSETLTIGSDGKATSAYYAMGDKYTIVETKAPDGYYTNSKTVTGTFSHKSGDTSWDADSVTNQESIADDYIYHAQLAVTKMDALTGSKAENGKSFAGAQFTLTDTTSGKSETLTTDANGNAVSTGSYVVGDKYTLTETKAPAGYQLNANVVSGTFARTKVNGYANTNSVAVKDSIIPDQITLHKVDETGANVVGARFVVAASKDDLSNGQYLRLSADGKSVLFPGQDGYANGTDYVVTSDANGIATWKNIVKPATKTDRTYYFKEISTDADHQLLTKAPSTDATDQGTNSQVKVVDATKIKLPNTGSIDHLIFAGVAVASLAAIGGISYVLINEKKKGNV